MPGASEQTSQVKVLNVNWIARSGRLLSATLSAHGSAAFNACVSARG